jgi:hypothetical protein
MCTARTEVTAYMLRFDLIHFLLLILQYSQLKNSLQVLMITCHTSKRSLVAERSCSDQVKEDDIDGASSTNGEKRNAYRLLVGKPEEETSRKTKT